MNRRIIGVIAAVALAAVGTGFLVAYVKSAERRALAGERVVDVYVVQEAIAQGTYGEQVRPLLTTEKVPVKVQAAGAVQSLSELDGKVAAVDLVPGEQLVAQRFIEPQALAAQRNIEVPEGLQQVTVSLEPQRAVGGQVSPGDTVGVMMSFDPFEFDGVIDDAGNTILEGGKTGNTTHLALHKVLVTQVQWDQVPAAAGGDDDPAAEPEPAKAPSGSLLVTLAVDAPQAEKVVFTAEFGRLWLTHEPENATEDGTKIQTRGTIYQ
jgi:pilus assembly protein CpaB